MARTQLHDQLGRDETNHCKVIIDGIGDNRPGKAKEFFMTYPKWKQDALIRKHIPKHLRRSFREIALMQAQRDTSAPKVNDVLRH